MRACVAMWCSVARCGACFMHACLQCISDVKLVRCNAYMWSTRAYMYTSCAMHACMYTCTCVCYCCINPCSACKDIIYASVRLFMHVMCVCMCVCKVCVACLHLIVRVERVWLQWCIFVSDTCVRACMHVCVGHGPV